MLESGKMKFRIVVFYVTKPICFKVNQDQNVEQYLFIVQVIRSRRWRVSVTRIISVETLMMISR